MLDIDKEKEISIINIFGKDKHEKWVKKYPILKNKDVKSWIRDKIDKFTDEGKKAEKFLITSYLIHLQQYCIFNGVSNPSELLEGKEKDVDIRNARVKKYLQYLLKFDETKQSIQELKDLGFKKSPTNATIRNNIQTKIKSFYSNRGLHVSYNLKSVKSGANKNEITLTRNLIKSIQSNLESANYRLVCKFETQTGLRIADVLEEITSGKYEIEKYQVHYFIRNFETQKEKVNINFLFFTQELTELLTSMYSKELETTVKDKDKNDIIIYDLKKLDLTKLFLTRQDTRINKNDYLRRLKDIVRELGISGNMKTHAFRKFFTDTIDSVEGKDDKFNKHIEGREPEYRDAVYLRSLKSIKKYYDKWTRLEQEICIDCIVYDKTNITIKNIEAKYNEMVKQNIEKDKEITKLKELGNKIEVMDKNFDKAIENLTTKEKEIDDLTKSVSILLELLLENSDNLTDKQKDILKGLIK